MPWNGCKFEGDPSTPAELLSKVQYSDPDTNQSLNYEGRLSCLDVSFFEGGRQKTFTTYETCDGIKKSSDYPCAVLREDWDGGLCNLDEDFPEMLDNAALTFNIIGKVAGLTGYAVKQIALNDYKKDLQGAKDKMRVASNNYSQAFTGADQVGNQIIGLGGNLDGLKEELEGLKQSLAFQWNGIQSILADLSSLNFSLGIANNELSKANAALAFASNRSNFPPGLPGSIMQKNAIKQANADIKSASLKISDLEVKISEKGVDLQASSDAYNETGKQGVATSQQILANQTAIQNLKSVYDSRVSAVKNAVSLRNSAIEDVKDAQTTLAGKIETAAALAQTAVGATGAGEALKYASAGEYYRATGRGINAGIDVGSSYIPGATSLNPYAGLLKTAISQGFDTFQTGGNIQNFGMNLGESLIGLKSAQQIFDATEGAFYIMENDPYAAWQILAQQTHQGVGVLGKITTTASPFLGAIPVTPFIPILIPIAQSTSSGLLSTAVEAGYKFSIGEGMSAPLGSGRLSGVSVLLFGGAGSILYGPINAMEKAFQDLFGNDEEGNSNTAVAIQRMAATGAQRVDIPKFRISIEMRSLDNKSDDTFFGDIME
jgi:hypothetical protein